MALNLSGPLQIPAQPLGTTGQTTQRHPLGTQCSDGDRMFRYGLVGGVTLVAGNWIQAPAQIANHLALTPVAGSVGDLTITVALGATLATANQYAGGYAIFSTAGGTGTNGIAYKIASHPAAALSTSVVLTLAEPIKIAFTTSARIDLQANMYSNVIQTPVTTLTGAVVGVATDASVTATYDWIQTHGPAAALIAGTPGVGLAVVCPGTAAGACVIDGAASATPMVGTMLSTGVDGKNNGVFVMID